MEGTNAGGFNGRVRQPKRDSLCGGEFPFFASILFLEKNDVHFFGLVRALPSSLAFFAIDAALIFS